MIKRLTFTVIGFSCFTPFVFSQVDNVLTIERCYQEAEQNYPLIMQYDLINKSLEYSLDNANKLFLPQLSLAGQATYQSAVTSIPFSLPGMQIDQVSKDQYKLYGEVVQPISDLFLIKDQKEVIESGSAIEKQKVEIEFYKLKERINNLYFGIILIDRQLAQLDLLKKDLQNGIDRTNVAIENGVAIKSNADNLLAEQLKADQRTLELKSNRLAFTNMLSKFIGIPINENTIFTVPAKVIVPATVTRPELNLFDLQSKSLVSQSKLLNAKTLPRASLFLQSGYGRPALNMLSNDFDPYFIGGLRLNWNFSSFYTIKKERQLIDLSQQGISVQKDVFLFNINQALEQQNTEVTKIESLIKKDESIIKLRASIKATTKLQLENGTATTNDYLIAVNAQDQAQQTKHLHEIQMLMTQYILLNTSGN